MLYSGCFADHCRLPNNRVRVWVEVKLANPRVELG